MKIAIIGTRGIPNRYGGFEQLAEQLSVGLLQKGHTVTVYNSHRHPYQLKDFKGVEIVHCYDAESRLGTMGQFIYDWNCIRDARKRDFDTILFLGYTSSSVWGNWYPARSVIISNMDGLEWKRSKYSVPVQRFLRYAEKLAVKHSDFLVADSPAIQSYLQKKYGIGSEYIAYGAHLLNSSSVEPLVRHRLSPGNYYILIARMEPENNIEMILAGFTNSNSMKKFIVIGNINNRYGKRLMDRFRKDSRIIFAGAIFDAQQLDALRSNASLYFHGHSAGGTNPSLLEAMASSCLIAAHDNEFNRAVLQNDAHWFSSDKAVQDIVESEQSGEKKEMMIKNNLQKIKEQYNWPRIIEQYNAFIQQCYNRAGR